MKTLLNICRIRNMKLAPSKFQLGTRVIYRGTVLEASRHKVDRKRSVYISPTQEKLEAFLNFQTPTCKLDIQAVCGIVAQLKRGMPGLMFEFPNL